MGTIQNERTGTTHSLPAQCLIGRSASCTLQVDDAYASSEHAKITWTGNEWTIRDLGSSNGTFVDGDRLEPGRARPLNVGARVGLGDVDGWVMDSDGAPTAVATATDGSGSVAAIADLLGLPNDDAPEVSIHRDATGRWIAESADGSSEVVYDQSVVEAGAKSWRLDLPVESEATPMADVSLSLATTRFRFAVTQDEERVAVTLIVRGLETQLEAREHSYLLLTLARARREDAHLPVDERGWRTISELQRMLRLQSNAINVAIHRARQQLAGAGLEGAAGIVAVRRGARRLGTDLFEITKLED
jgi:hypothetical protein